LRVEVDKRNEKLGLKIREAEISKTPYILTIGKSEMENETVSVRQYGGKQIGEIELKDFISITKKDIPKEDGL
jgi:threonyl-tRNA synthetase